MRTSPSGARVFGLVVLLSWASAGCGDSAGAGSGAGGSGGDNSVGGGSTGGGGQGPVGGGGDDGLQCGVGQTDCDGVCASLSSDEEHCGACDSACSANESCKDGVCRVGCGQGEVLCGSSCVDLFSDADNCGACGNTCPGEQACESGACVLACVGGATPCGSECVDLESDPDHCGACGVECAVGEFCSPGGCGLACGGGTTECGGRCFDLDSSESHCGDCDEACDDGEVCISGTCGVVCPAGWELCDDNCVDLDESESHCGACGNVCPDGPNSASVCEDGGCSFTCIGGFAECDGDLGNGCESSPTDDPANCGACGVACGAGELCSAGSCVLDVRANLLLCGSSRRDVGSFIPPGANLSVIYSCFPDSDTQAMLISRGGVGLYDPNGVRDYVAAGGRILTEYSASRAVFEDLFQVSTSYGEYAGDCLDVIPTLAQFNPDDPFWQDNPFALPSDGVGCGQDVSTFESLTPLAGWSPSAVSVGYRDLGFGRVWITEFDWQDTEVTGADYAYTQSLMGYMITGLSTPENLGDMFASFESEGRTVGLWKTPPCASLSLYENFCPSKGLSWWSPRSEVDGQALIDFAFSLDEWHTWIQVYGTVSTELSGAVNGFPVSVEGPGCDSASSDGWTAFRKWGCSFCDPELNGENVSCCWDASDHEYDWFVCEF